jgi:ATP-dependent Zn protease
VAIALAGMASEELSFGESGTGPGADLAGATETAALMVGALGMAGTLVSYEAVNEGPVSRRNLVAKVLGDVDTKRRVEDLLHAQKERVQALLGENRDLVEALRDALIARDELVGDEILEVLTEAVSRRRQSPEPSRDPAAAAGEGGGGARDELIIDLTGEPADWPVATD